MFLEYDFTIVYKPNRTHVVANALSRLLDITKPISVLNQTTNASLFYTRPKWLNDAKEFLKAGQLEGTLSMQQKQKLVKKVEPFTLKIRKLYIMGQNNKLQQCLTTIEA